MKEQYWDNLARIDLAKSTMDFMTVRKEPIMKPRQVVHSPPKKIKHSVVLTPHELRKNESQESELDYLTS